MILHQYQLDGTNEVSEATRRYTEILRQLNTGGGKTVEFSHIAKRYIAKHLNKAALILVHRDELQQQTRKTLWESVKISPQLISAGMTYIPPSQVYVGMVESTHTRTHLIKNIGLVIIDECHEEIFTKVYNQYRTGPDNTFAPGDPIIVGFSATPIAANKNKPLNRLYKKIVVGPQVNELIQLGRLYPLQGLCQNITRAPKDVIDRLSLTVRGGEFDNFNMSESYRKPRYVKNTVKAYQKYSEGKKAIVFNVNVAHSQDVCKAFVDAGYQCKHVDAKTPKGKVDPVTGRYPIDSRKGIFQWYKDTPGAILCNCDIARLGFDEPSIECVIVNLSTMSLTKWLQMAGRGGRRYPGKEYFDIIDMGGNAHTHGDWNTDRDWADIFHNPPKPSKGGGVAAVKTCPECDAVIHAATRVCPICSHVFPEKEIALEADLHEFIIVTKGIDVAAIMASATNAKEYFPLFQISRVLATHAKKTIKEMTDERANFIALEYEKRGKEWHELHNLKRQTEAKQKGLPVPDKRVFSSTMKNRCREILFNELKTAFPLWKKDTSTTVPQPPPTIKNITKEENGVQNLRALHYEL